ncbi:hypothetical protein PRNP1_012871 [Phytophthora ramorum]
MIPPPTMKNAVYRFGDRTSYKTIKQTTEPVPAVRDHEVLVEIHGVTLNYRDLAISKSEYPSTVTEHVVPCSDGAGVVVSVGSAVEDIDVGDRVITNFDVTNLYGPVLNGGSHRLGGVLDGMLRQYAAVPAQAVIKIPEECTLDFVQLASLVCAGVTAWNALPIKSTVSQSQSPYLLATSGTSDSECETMSRGYVVALLWGAAVAAYMSPLVTSRSSGGWDFLYIWDDRSNFVENQVLHGSWSFQTLYEMFTMVRLNVFEPLGWILKFFVVQMVGLDAWWVRVVSGIVHFAAGLVLAKVSALVLDIDYVLTESKRPSVHPIHAEIVAWPSAQPYTLAALFSYSALLVHVQDIHQNLCKSLKGNADGSAVDSKVLLDSIFGDGSTRSSLLSSALYLCALLSKSISILLPAGFFLVDLWVYSQLSPRPAMTRTLLLISTSVLTHWRNEDSLYEFSLRADPADWKILGQRAEYLLHAERCASNGAECRHLWILANEFSPRGTLKSQLYRLHLLVVLGDAVRACDGYLSLLKDNPDNSSVHNNAAVCFAVRGKLTEARREFSRALQTPTIKDTMATHTKNSRTFDEWEAQHALHSADEWPGFVGTLTY